MGIEFVRHKKGWQGIPLHEKKIIKKSILDLSDNTKDRRDALSILFEKYNLYMGGRYKPSSQTCGSCVSNVVNTFKAQIEKENG